MITVIQPDPKVTLDRFAEWLQDDFEVVAPTPRLEDCGDRIIVLGGTMNALGQEFDGLRQLLRDAVAADIPVLGICLGHQLLATAFGGEVVVGHKPGKEDGAYEITVTEAGENDSLLGALKGKVLVAESHNDVVMRMPEGATLLATSERAIQAFRVGSAVGVQFHPEASPQTMAYWATLSGEDAARMEAEMNAVDERVAAVGRSLAEKFSQ